MDLSDFPFAEASSYVNDSYWAVVVDQCSMNKFPAGFYFNEGWLVNRFTQERTELPTDPEILATVCIRFFRDVGKIYSAGDIENIKTCHIDASPLKIKKILSSNTLLSICLKEYLHTLYPESEVRDKELEILSLVHSGQLTEENFVAENGRIVSIDFNLRPKKYAIKDSIPEIRETVQLDYEKEWLSYINRGAKKKTRTPTVRIYTPSVDSPM